jgi:hypothetical protein
MKIIIQLIVLMMIIIRHCLYRQQYTALWVGYDQIFSK